MDHVHVLYTTAKLFPHLALSGQCIVDCQQCTVGSGPLVGLRRLHVSLDTDVGWCRGGLFTQHVAAVEDLCAAPPPRGAMWETQAAM